MHRCLSDSRADQCDAWHDAYRESRPGSGMRLIGN